MNKIVEGAKEALAVARGEEPAARITIHGHAYVPLAAFDDLRRKAQEMRHAIDMLEGALMGYGDLVDLPEHFDGSPPALKIKPTVTVEQMRRVCEALSECTRIINSDEYLT